MSTTRRGVTKYESASATTNHNVPLPAGSAVGDWVIMGASTQAFSAVITLPGISLYAEGSNSQYAAISKKQLTSTDVVNGFLTASLTSNQQLAAVLVGYAESLGFGTPGGIWRKGPMGGTFVSRVDTEALALASANPDGDILCFSLIKHSGGSQAFVSIDSPATSLIAAVKTGGGMPSAHVGVYSGPPEDITTTWSYASTNGVGIQIPVLSVSTDPEIPEGPELMGEWVGSGYNGLVLLGRWNGAGYDPLEVEIL